MSTDSPTYRILDEPQPSTLSHLAVQPLWPLLAVMFGGTWIAWPWFALNAFAVGSPSRVKELLWAVGGFLGTAMLTVGIFSLYAAETVGDVGMQYLIVTLSVWKLLVSYRLYILQARTFSLYEYFGGTVRNGLLVILAATFLRPQVLGNLPGFIQIVLS